MPVLIDAPTHRFAARCAEEISLEIRSVQGDVVDYKVALEIDEYHNKCASVCIRRDAGAAVDDFVVGSPFYGEFHYEAELMFDKLAREHPGDVRYTLLRDHHGCMRLMIYRHRVPNKGKGDSKGKASALPDSGSSP